MTLVTQTLYEEVKSARNKYVNEIQSSSQQLAELKQRIKIAQNELEILKNESVEKEKSLLKLIGSTKKQIHERDKKRAKLNKSEFEKQKLIEQGNQQANQIAKLNMITLSLQGDMLEIRKHYETACDSRNDMGVQLIDRNDELYEFVLILGAFSMRRRTFKRASLRMVKPKSPKWRMKSA